MQELRQSREPVLAADMIQPDIARQRLPGTGLRTVAGDTADLVTKFAAPFFIVQTVEEIRHAGARIVRRGCLDELTDEAGIDAIRQAAQTRAGQRRGIAHALVARGAAQFLDQHGSLPGGIQRMVPVKSRNGGRRGK